MTSVIENSTGYCAHGKVCSRAEAEASFRRRRSPHACLFAPGTYRGYYGDDFGPDAWFVGLYYDPVVEPPGKKPGTGETVKIVLLISLFITIIVAVSVAMQKG